MRLWCTNAPLWSSRLHVDHTTIKQWEWGVNSFDLVHSVAGGNIILPHVYFTNKGRRHKRRKEDNLRALLQTDQLCSWKDKMSTSIYWSLCKNHLYLQSKLWTWFSMLPLQNSRLILNLWHIASMASHLLLSGKDSPHLSTFPITVLRWALNWVALIQHVWLTAALAKLSHRMKFTRFL